MPRDRLRLLVSETAASILSSETPWKTKVLVILKSDSNSEGTN